MPSFLNFCSKSLITSSPSRLTTILFTFSSLFIIYLIVSRCRISTVHIHRTPYLSPAPPTSLHHLVFALASSSNTWPKRKDYVSIWWKPYDARGYVFLDRTPTNQTNFNRTDTLPRLLVSEDTSRFPYTFRGGLRSAIRVSRIVKEVVDRNVSDVRWFVFGDDDTVFFAENLAKTLSKYDHDRWFYVGSNSESFDQNSKYSFDMAFGGGGFAISYPLARVLARVLDSCLMRYSHLYGSDSRIFSCLAEIGVGLTHESGFHQVDIRGDMFGMLSAHPLALLVSLHHLDYVDPIFPNMSRTEALKHLFEAVNVDPQRILQQTVCYDHSNSWTISISWGYAVQVFQGNQLLPDLLSLPRTFMPWKRSVNVNSNPYMFNLREFPKDRCQRPTVFFLESVFSDEEGIKSNYNRYFIKNCSQRSELKNLEQIRVFSQKLDLDVGQLRAPRRHCCDILHSSFDKRMEIGIRQCRDEELISMN